jgi:hypothetical protein
MKLHTHTRLTIGGFCLAYFGPMGGLLLVGLPLLEGHRLQVLLYWVVPLTLASRGRNYCIRTTATDRPGLMIASPSWPVSQ